MTLLWPVSCTQCDDSWSWSWIWIRITISRKRLSDHTQRREKGQRRDRGDQHGGAFLGGSSLISPTSPNVISLGHPHSGLLRLFLLALTLVSISISILICQLFSPYPPLLPPPAPLSLSLPHCVAASLGPLSIWFLWFCAPHFVPHLHFVFNSYSYSHSLPYSFPIRICNSRIFGSASVSATASATAFSSAVALWLRQLPLPLPLLPCWAPLQPARPQMAT